MTAASNSPVRIYFRLVGGLLQATPICSMTPWLLQVTQSAQSATIRKHLVHRLPHRIVNIYDWQAVQAHSLEAALNAAQVSRQS